MTRRLRAREQLEALALRWLAAWRFRGEFWLLLLLLPLSLLADLDAAVPARTYYFRDFSLGFYPLRLFQAQELGAGRWPGWNPYLHEGSFGVPSLYPPDLLHVLWPGPASVSWLLTLHFPLAALAFYGLARDLGLQRRGAFLGAAVYAQGGFALSCLNLYVYLQALALAPAVLLSCRRAAARGGRWIPGAALIVATAISTLALEFVGPSLVLGAGLALAWTPSRRQAARVALALGLGVGVAALPIAVTAALLQESLRAGGVAPEEALQYAVHPAALLQILIPEALGSVAAPLERWWGGRFVPGGVPYFTSLYIGPLVLALAPLGAVRLGPSRRLLLVSGALAFWFALGPWGGLAPVLVELPLLNWFRYPSKALLVPYLVTALLAGGAVDRLADRSGWRRFGLMATLAAAAALAVAAVVFGAGDRVGQWLEASSRMTVEMQHVLGWGSLHVALVAALGGLLAVAVIVQRLTTGAAATTVVVVIVLDLARAGSGLNPQAPPAFFKALPGMAAQELSALAGGRIFPFPALSSRSFRAFLARREPGVGVRALYANRQILDPFNNMIDRVEAAETPDRGGFMPYAPLVRPHEYDPRQVARLLPRLRNAAVTRILSFDPLVHADLRLRATVPVPGTGLFIHVYEVGSPWPRAYVACRVLPADSRQEALQRPFEADFDGARDAALEVPARADCSQSRVTALEAPPGRERYRVKTDGSGLLVTRGSFTRGWRARVNGVAQPVLRVNGKHRGVPLEAGNHQVDLDYEPPGLRAGGLVSLLAVVAVLALLLRPVLLPSPPGPS